MCLILLLCLVLLDLDYSRLFWFYTHFLLPFFLFGCYVWQLATEESKNFSVRNIFIVLVPNKALLQKGQESSKKTEKSAATEISAGV